MKANLIYEDYDVNMNESTNEKSRNICLLGNLDSVASGAIVPPPVPPVPPVKPPVPPVPPVDLNAAGPEEEEVVITPEQTEPKSGPEFWIFLLLAFAFSGAWTAWKKQKA